MVCEIFITLIIQKLLWNLRWGMRGNKFIFGIKRETDANANIQIR